MLYFIITQQQLGKMARPKHTLRKSLVNVPRLPADIIVVIAAEVEATPRLDFQLVGYQTYLYLGLVYYFDKDRVSLCLILLGSVITFNL